MTFRHKLAQSLLSMLALAIPLFIIGPLILFAANQSEFGVGFGNLFPLLTTILGACLLIAVIFPLMPCRFFEKICALFIALAVGVYVQGAFLVWDFGLFDGHAIDWSEYRRQIWGECLMWGGLIFTALYFAHTLMRHLRWYVAFLIGAPLLAVVVTFSQTPLRWSSERQFSDFDKFYRLSPESNIIYVILDTFSAPEFDRLATSDPEIAETFSDFVFFKNVSSSFPTTAPSIPLLLSGIEYDNRKPLKQFEEAILPQSLPSRLAADGYEVDIASLPQLCHFIRASMCEGLGALVTNDAAAFRRIELAKLLDLTLFRYLPTILKRVVYNDESWLLQSLLGKQQGPLQQSLSIAFADSLVAKLNVTPGPPVFKFLHLLLPHPPTAFDRQCHLRRKHPADKKGPTVSRYEEQARCALLLTSRLLDRLKKLNVYEQSLIVVSADHGYSGKYGRQHMRQDIPNIEKALPLVLIKRPNQKNNGALVRSHAPGQLRDIPATIASIIGKDYAFNGQSLFSLDDTQNRQRRFYSYRWRNRNWATEYLPSMHEYLIQGDAWSADSWSDTGRILEGGK